MGIFRAGSDSEFRGLHLTKLVQVFAYSYEEGLNSRTVDAVQKRTHSVLQFYSICKIYQMLSIIYFF